MQTIEVVPVSDETLYALCREVRRQVFIEEQGVPVATEIDGHENESIHFLAMIEKKPVGAGRLRLKKSYVKFERIATLKDHRGQGIGRILMEKMLSYALQRFPNYLPAMHAQESAVGFYVKLGWVPIGAEFPEANIPHRVLIYPPRNLEVIQQLKIWNDPHCREDIRAHLRTIM